jgi:SAM-dependent methyltransferase
MNECKICRNVLNNKTHSIQEVENGKGDFFTYLECSKCGCLQLMEIPSDMGKYYSEDYYSFAHQAGGRDNPFKRFFRRQRTAYYLGAKNVGGALLARIAKSGPPPHFDYFKRAGVSLRSKLLDVGCGHGALLRALQTEGFDGLTGIDPFIAAPIDGEHGLRLLKTDIFNVHDSFDCIMFNHSFEHMKNPAEVLRTAYALLNDHACVILQIPLASSYAWRHYGGNWVQLSVPRHFFLHTVASVGMLAEQNGFHIKDTIFNSTEFQFWGSEQYIRGIPMYDDRSYAKKPATSIFSQDQIEAFKQHAKTLNEKADGDMACFILRKKTP